MMPIPRHLLIHTAILQNPSTPDAWQYITYQSRPLSYVRIDPTSKVVRSKDNTEIQLSSVLLYDCHNSRPCGIHFYVGQRITWQGNDYTVQTIEPMYDGKRLHHWEVGLV